MLLYFNFHQVHYYSFHKLLFFDHSCQGIISDVFFVVGNVTQQIISRKCDSFSKTFIFLVEILIKMKGEWNKKQVPFESE